MIKLKSIKFKIKRFTYYTFFYLNKIIFTKKNKKLFISTGYFGTLIASTLAKRFHNSENYLLITLDRQDKESNIKWANVLNPNWSKIDIINHKDYYEIDEINFNHIWKNIFFDEVYSNHIENLTLVKKFFYHKKIHVYEEGLATYYAYNKKINEKFYNKVFFLNKELLISLSEKVVLINPNEFLDILNSAIKYYPIKTLQNKNNVVYLMPGLQPYENNEHYFNFHYKKILEIKNKKYNVYVSLHPRVNIDFPDHINVIKNIPIVDMFLIKNKSNISYIYSQYSTLTTYSEILYEINPIIIETDVKNKYQKELKRVQDLYLTSNIKHPKNH